MANSKDNLQKYGKGFIGFDEPSGNVIDSIGGWTGTLYNAPTRVTGWNGKGSAMNFNGVNQYVGFNESLIPIGAKTIRFKVKTNNGNNSGKPQYILNEQGTKDSGWYITITVDGNISFIYYNGTSNVINIEPIYNIANNTWHDIVFYFPNEIGKNAIVYIDDMVNPKYNFATTATESGRIKMPTFIGKPSSTNSSFLNGQLDAIEFYDRMVSPIPDKYLVVHNSQYKYHNGTVWQTTTTTEENFKKYGMSQLSQITEAQWKELSGAKSLAMWSDFEDKKWSNAVLNVESYAPQQLLGDTSQVIYYTDSGVLDVAVIGDTEPFSVYDYIGEFPEVVVHSETADDISISTNVEPFTIYDEFEDNVEVLFYTNDDTTTGAHSIIDANWSPVDDLGDAFDVVSWTDEADASRALELNAIPKPQFLYVTDVPTFQNGVSKLLTIDNSVYNQQSPVRFLLTSDNSTWYTWRDGVFATVALTHDNILTQGITSEQLALITEGQLATWPSEKMNIGVYLYDSVREVFQSKIQDIGYETQLYSQTSKIEDINLYILNTTATIQIQLDGLTLTGQVDDEDMTRVQYRVLLNKTPYYPETGDFTPLSAPPLNIDLTLRSDEIKINDWNNIKVEFKDYFGTVDYWEADFLGRYAGLMFTDKTGDYYSTDLGQVLQYLDFGQILTGQISVTHEVIVENTYGYDLTDVNIAVNTNQFAQGLHVQLGSTEENVQEISRISLGDIADTAKQSFFIRLASDVNAIPNNSTTFNIIATANRNIVREN